MIIAMGIWGGRTLNPTPPITGDLESISQDIGQPDNHPNAYPTPDQTALIKNNRTWEGKATGQNNSIKAGSNLIQRIIVAFGWFKGIDPRHPDIQLNRQDNGVIQSAGTGRNDPTTVEGIHPALRTNFNPNVSTTQLPAKTNTGMVSPIRR